MPDASRISLERMVNAVEKVREHEPAANPDVTESSDAGPFRVLALEALVRIELTAFRDKDRTHLRDLIGVGLVDRSWVSRLPTALADRLTRILDTPDG